MDKEFGKEDIEKELFISQVMIGDCPDCGYLWCLECRSELSIENLECKHWGICGECGKTDEFPEDCPSKEEDEEEDFVVNPCFLVVHS